MKRCVNMAALLFFQIARTCVGSAVIGGLVASRWEGWDFSFICQAEEGGSVRCHPSPLFFIVCKALLLFRAQWPRWPYYSPQLIEWERTGNKSSWEPPDIEPWLLSESVQTKITINHTPAWQSCRDVGVVGSAVALVGRFIFLAWF